MVIVGSSSIRSQLYSADYDAMEKVSIKSAAEVVKHLQSIIKKLRVLPDCFIGDIKCGEIKDWDPFSLNAHVNMDNEKIIDFNIKKSQSKIDELARSNVISPNEAKGAIKLLDKATTPMGFLTAKKEIRYHILRWKPYEILEGHQAYRGLSVSLEDAIMSGGLIKIDLVSNIDNRFTEFSVIYNLYKGGVLITKKPLNLINSLKEDVMFYGHLSPFKGMKRMFALAKAQKDEAAMQHLIPLLNSDLGRLYQIISDLTVIHDLLERPQKPIKEIRYQLDEMKARMGNLYQLRDFLKEEHDIIGQIESALKKQNPKADIYKLLVLLQHILNSETLRQLGEIKGAGIFFSRPAKVAPAPTPPRRQSLVIRVPTASDSTVQWAPTSEVADRVPTLEGHEIIERDMYGNPVQLILGKKEQPRVPQWKRDARGERILDSYGNPIPILATTRLREMPTAGILRTGEEAEVVDIPSSPTGRSPRVGKERRDSMYPARSDPVFNFITDIEFRKLPDEVLIQKYKVLDIMLNDIRQLNREERASYIKDEDFKRLRDELRKVNYELKVRRLIP